MPMILHENGGNMYEVPGIQQVSTTTCMSYRCVGYQVPGTTQDIMVNQVETQQLCWRDKRLSLCQADESTE